LFVLFEVVGVVNVESVSVMIAAVSVIATAVFALLQLRNLGKDRQVQFLLQLQSTITSEEYRNAWAKIRDCPHASYDDCLKIEHDFELVIAFFDSMGVLLKRRLIGVGPISDLFGVSIIRGWERCKSYVEGARKEVNDPKLYWAFEFLYNEIQKESALRKK
jgi:hypothetical protein